MGVGSQSTSVDPSRPNLVRGVGEKGKQQDRSIGIFGKLIPQEPCFSLRFNIIPWSVHIPK